MDQHILTFAFPFDSAVNGAGLVRLAQEVCKNHDLYGNPPKMGAHATIIPPFKCTEREKKAVAILTRQMWRFNGHPVDAQATGFGVFGPAKPDSNIGAIYVALELDEQYRQYIEKHKLEWPFEFVHPPSQTTAVDRVWIPHLSVIEGPNLHERAPKHFPSLNEYVRDRIVTLREPLFFEKKTLGQDSYWSQVLV